jgi:sugar O-acyltransferase (sialic acid O-acetyltransferase NeuD family)
METTDMKDIAIFGAGGMGRETACIINRINAFGTPVWNFVGFYDDGLQVGEQNELGTILGGMAELNTINHDLAIVIALGNPQILKKIRQQITNPHITFPNIIDPSVDFWHRESLQIGEGNIICPHCLLSCGVHMGSYNILNGDVSLRHDVVLGNYNAIMPGVRISGGVTIGDGNFFGLNAAVTQYVEIGNEIRIGAGAIVMNSLFERNLYVGIPAHIK